MKAYTYEMDDHLQLVYLADDADPHEKLLDASRADWADKFYPYEPTAKDWMEVGYTYTCLHCEHTLSLSEGYCDKCSGEMDEDDLNEANAVIVFDGMDAYCGDGCKKAEYAERARRQAAKEKCKADFLAEFPFATVTDIWTGGIANCKCFHENHDNACLHWTVPGATTGDYANSFCGGCCKAWVCNGDREAFEKAKSS